MAKIAITVAAANGTLRTCSGVSPTAPGGRRAAVLGRWRPLAPANLRLSSPAVRVPRATSAAAVEEVPRFSMDSVGVDVGLRLGHDERKKATDSRVPPVSDKRMKERRGCWTSGDSAELGRCGAVRPTRQARGKQPRPDGPRREGGRAIGLPGHFAQDWSNTDIVPIPKVIIDQDSDPDATIVEITLGDRLGELLDTMNALKNLGLNVIKASVCLDSTGKHNKFSITKASTGRKIDDPELLEAIRLTIINNMIVYHPESSSQLAMGATFGPEAPTEEVDVDIATHIDIYDGPERSLLVVETADRPGLLVDLVKIISDININVQSGEFDTEGLLAKAKFHVSYRGKPLMEALKQVLSNSLRYFLRRPTTEDASF